MSKTKLIAATLLIPIFLSINLSTVSADTFTDVHEGNAYFVAISYLKEKNIIEGYEDGSFKPKNKISRAEALKMLTLASGVFKYSPKEAEKAPFKDTPLKEWYTKYLAAAKEKKIIDGYKDGSFKPENNINLSETLKIYFESINSVNKDQIDYNEGLNFVLADAPAKEWFSKYTGYAAFHEIININDANNIDPNQQMTRGYLAEIIYRTMQIESGFSFGKATYYFGLPTKNNDYYDQNLMLTAHKTLPFGTILEVTNMANGKSVKVKVSDRGPFGPGRVLDLSKTAFAKIAKPSEGVIPIQFHQVSPEI